MTDANTLPTLILGTAMWGWNVEAKEAYRILDVFYENGFRKIDAATNYPINKKAEDFRRSEQILESWIRSNGVRDLEVMIKVGSLNNLFTPDHNLSPSFLRLNWQYYLGHLETNLATFMIHWDNRDDLSTIQESFAVLDQVYQSGLQVGASGVRHPALYARVNQLFKLPLHIQIKHNLMYTDFPRYAVLGDDASYYSYGINAGGMKLQRAAYTNSSTLKARGGQLEKPPIILEDLQAAIQIYNQQNIAPPIQKMNEVAMCFALLNAELSGVLIGPSKVDQLKASLAFYGQIQQYDYKAFFQNLLKIHRTHAPTDRSL